MLNKITNYFANKLKDKKIDYILALEARDFLFGVCVAYKIGVELIPVRKIEKLPPLMNIIINY